MLLLLTNRSLCFLSSEILSLSLSLFLSSNRLDSFLFSSVANFFFPSPLFLLLVVVRGRLQDSFFLVLSLGRQQNVVKNMENRRDGEDRRRRCRRRGGGVCRVCFVPANP